ncbi:GerAB/ArcD/ProY family transporter [Ureibacillus acetophenoni]
MRQQKLVSQIVTNPWILAKIASSFPNQSFFTFSSYLLSKPIALIISILFLLQFLGTVAFQVREVTVLAHQYLFDRTPIEVISLSFLLVIVYGVSGSRAAIFRICVLFYPTLIFGVLILILMPFSLFEVDNLFPIFQTNFEGYLRGSYSSLNIFLGFSIILFYIALVKEPKKSPVMVVKGIMTGVLFTFLLFLTCIGVFANATTRNLFFPVFDLSRAVEIPGGFFERFDVILFVIWTMIIFVSTLFTMDLIVMIIMMVFKKAKKMNVIFTITPIIFLISMLPIDYIELTDIGSFLANWMLVLLILSTILLGITYKLKGGNQN